MKNRKRDWKCLALLVAGSFLNGAVFAQEVDCPEGLSAFEATVYTKMSIDCSECHNGSDAKAPGFVRDDPAESYRFILNYVDFIKAEESLLAVRAGNDHCKMSSCNEASGRDMVEQIQAWWNEGEKTCNRQGRFFSQDVEIPAELPNRAEGFTKMTWDLGVLGSAFEGITFELEAQRFFESEGEASGTYKFRKPRFVTGDKVLKVSNVRVLLNGHLDTLANHYSSVERVVSPQKKADGVEESPYPVLSPRSLLLLEDMGAGDKVSLSFENIEVVDAPVACKSIDTFKTNVMTQFNALNCYSCHGGGESNLAGSLPAKAMFNMALNDEELCQASLQRADLKNVLHSPLIAYPLRNMHGHPAVEGDIYKAFTDLRAWIEAER